MVPILHSSAPPREPSSPLTFEPLIFLTRIWDTHFPHTFETCIFLTHIWDTHFSWHTPERHVLLTNIWGKCIHFPHTFETYVFLNIWDTYIFSNVSQQNVFLRCVSAENVYIFLIHFPHTFETYVLLNIWDTYIFLTHVWDTFQLTYIWDTHFSDTHLRHTFSQHVWERYFPETHLRHTFEFTHIFLNFLFSTHIFLTHIWENFDVSYTFRGVVSQILLKNDVTRKIWGGKQPTTMLWCDFQCLIPPENGEIALQTPRTEFWWFGWYSYSTNYAAKMKLLTLLVEISQSTMLVHFNLNIQVTWILYY